MNIGLDFRYLCTMRGNHLFVHGIAHFDRIHKDKLPYKWTCAITESYMQQLIDDDKINVVWYQEEFDFDF